MNDSVQNYRNTTVNWGKTQGEIMKMLQKRGINDIQFTNISGETMAKNGLEMKPNTDAIVLVFQKPVKLPDGTSGNIPVRIMIPNIRRDDQKAMNQYYRLLFWYLKSKFEAIDTGLVEFAEEFMAHLQITSPQGFVSRLWDNFKSGYYRAIGSGDQGNANLLPPMSKKDQED